jgi:hypothetical protein
MIPPAGITAVFLGDLVDRGPNSPDVLRLMDAGNCLLPTGNHALTLQKYLNGKNIQLKHGLQTTVEQLAKEDDRFKNCCEPPLWISKSLSDKYRSFRIIFMQTDSFRIFTYQYVSK